MIIARERERERQRERGGYTVEDRLGCTKRGNCVSSERERGMHSTKRRKMLTSMDKDVHFVPR